MCPADVLGPLLGVGWIALVTALVLGALAFLVIVTRPARAVVEAPLGRFVGRRARERHGIVLDAPPWACRACHSVNEAVAATCYACGAAASEAGQALPPSGDETWRPPAPPNRFDPSLYRGPGAPAPADGTTKVAAHESTGPAAPPEETTPEETPPEETPPDVPSPGHTIGP